MTDHITLFSYPLFPLSAWTSPSVVRATFDSVGGEVQGPEAGDTVNVIGGLLRAACLTHTRCDSNIVLMALHSAHAPSLEYSRSLSVGPRRVVQPPLLALLPVVVIILPTQVGACSDLTVDLSMSSGSGGRSWASITWSVVATNGEGTTLAAFITSNFDRISNSVIVPRHQLAIGSYQITVILSNFLGFTASQSALVAVTGRRKTDLLFLVQTLYICIWINASINSSSYFSYSSDIEKAIATFQ